MDRCAGAGWLLAGVCLALAGGATAQQPIPASPSVARTNDAPLPDLATLLLDVERNQRRSEAAQNQYTYHVHVDTQQLNGRGEVKKTISRDSESLTLDGVRVERTVARDGKPLTDDEKKKESERIDKIVAKARNERTRRASKGQETDANGEPIIPVSRILELGSFSHARREMLDGRPTIVADYEGDPKARTRNTAEGIIRVLTGTVWIDEQDRALVRGEGTFRDDFKILGGLVLDIHKGLRFQFRSTYVNNEVWLPASIDGQGSLRALLFESFDGTTHYRASDYRKFRATATILPGVTAVDPPSDGAKQPGTVDTSTPPPQSPH